MPRRQYAFGYRFPPSPRVLCHDLGYASLKFRNTNNLNNVTVDYLDKVFQKNPSLWRATRRGFFFAEVSKPIILPSTSAFRGAHFMPRDRALRPFTSALPLALSRYRKVDSEFVFLTAWAGSVVGGSTVDTKANAYVRPSRISSTSLMTMGTSNG